MALDEYTVIPVFLAGVLTQAALVARDRKGFAWIGGLLVSGLVAAWYISGPEDRAFGVPLLTTLIFVIGYGIIFRDRLLPPTSVRTLLHCTVLLYYAAWIDATQEVTLPTSIIVPALLPFVGLLILNFVPQIPAALRVLAYAWYLVALVFLVPFQISVDHLKGIFESSGFSLPLYGYVFFSGTVFLFFAAHVIHLFMLLPIHRRRRDLIDLMLGTSPGDVSRETAATMAERVRHAPMNALGWALFLGHGGLLVTNARYAFLDHDLVTNGSIAVLAWGASAAGLFRREQRHE